MPNRLKEETSPYLRQHAENPVDWYPWGREAFERARVEDKPVFLSIGYSTCHWCHVMARESFENGEIAELLNRAFIAVKVDREERPDIDSVYMTVCQTFTGSGGWPMSIFMTWDQKPFFAGTYFPPRSRQGAPGFLEVLTAVAEKWSHDRAGLLETAGEIVTALQQTGEQPAGEAAENLTERAANLFARSFDHVCGGFGAAPKFPAPHNLLFLMVYSRQTQDEHAMEMAEKTLCQMRKGGIYDQIGGGFSRYSTDRFFLAPHFEKMLYDNAWLIVSYTAAYQFTGKNLYLDTARETADYILREMTAPGGGFYSAQDADSDGVEGKYYTFTPAEIIGCLGAERGRRFCQVFDITLDGNFEGKSIPNLLKSGRIYADFSGEKELLREYRKGRANLHLDDKILTAWNAMAIGALSMLYRACREPRYLAAAKRAQDFLTEHLQEGEQVFTSFRDGKHTDQGFLDDYAYEVAALLELYGSTLEEKYLRKAEELCAEAVLRFSDGHCGGYFLSGATELFMDPKETYDGAVPSGNSMMAYNFVRLYRLTEQEKYRELAERQLAFLASAAREYPMGHSMFLLAKCLFDAPEKHVTFVWERSEELARARDRMPFWGNVRAVRPSAAYPMLNGKATVYVCDKNGCRPPSNDIRF